MKGYTARLRVDISEDSKFASCYICVIKGEYGSHLEWPFRGTFIVSIKNHLESGKDYSRQLSSENGAQPSSNGETMFGERTFIQFSELLALDQPCLYLISLVSLVVLCILLTGTGRGLALQSTLDQVGFHVIAPCFLCSTLSRVVSRLGQVSK